YLLHFFFPVTPPPYISTLSLHDALPICLRFIDRTLLVAVLAGTVHSKSGGCYMRALSIALLVLLTAVQASAEQSTADESAQLRRGARMIWTGVALIGAGALTVPITRDSQRSDGPLVAVSGLMF